jgi:hypothetical protein
MSSALVAFFRFFGGRVMMAEFVRNADGRGGLLMAGVVGIS